MDQLIIEDPLHPARVASQTPWLQRHPIVGGAALGAAWGVIMRVWMRFIAANPEFSLAATLFIVGAATMVGAVLGLARLRRRSGGVGWWRLSILSLLLLGAGGAVMWPAVILGGIGLGLARPRSLRMVLVAGAFVSQVPVMRSILDDNWSFAVWESVVAVAWYLPMLALEAWAFSVVFSPAVPPAPVPGPVRKTLIWLPVVATSGLAMVALGVAG